MMNTIEKGRLTCPRVPFSTRRASRSKIPVRCARAVDTMIEETARTGRQRSWAERAKSPRSTMPKTRSTDAPRPDAMAGVTRSVGPSRGRVSTSATVTMRAA
jgi:hypothetical protein